MNSFTLADLSNRDLAIIFFAIGLFVFLAFCVGIWFLFRNIRQSQKLVERLMIKGVKIDQKTSDLLKLAEDFWRIEKSVNENEEKTKIIRNLERIKRYFKSQDLEYLDYTNHKYIDGMNIEVMSITKRKGIDKAQICQTYRPEIRWKGSILQRTQVDIVEPKPLEKFSISFEPAGGNFLPSLEALEDSSVSLSVEPQREGYRFVGWTEANDGQKAVSFPLTVTRNLVLQANWEKIEIQEFLPSEEETLKTDTTPKQF